MFCDVGMRLPRKGERNKTDIGVIMKSLTYIDLDTMISFVHSPGDIPHASTELPKLHDMLVVPNAPDLFSHMV